MDIVEQFQELTGIERNTAVEILEHFNYDLQSAVSFIFEGGNPKEDVEMVQEDAKASSSFKPPKSPERRLSFDIVFSKNKSKDCLWFFQLTDVDESQTLGDLKLLMINQNLDELVPVAKNLGIQSDVVSMKEAVRFEGMPNCGGLTNDTTLKSLHLPLNNSWTAFFKRSSRNRNREDADGSTFSYDLQIRILGSVSRSNGASTSQSPNGKLVRLRHVDENTTLSELRRLAAKESKISVSNLHWSLSDGLSSYSSIELLVSDLNTPSKDNALLRYKLKRNRPYILEVSNSPSPSSSRSSGHASNSFKNARTNRSKRRVSAELDQEMDNDEDDMQAYECSDDDGDADVVKLSESLNPHSLPLMPASLLSTPEKALENFWNVFVQRYCSESDGNIPSFCLQPFQEAFKQSVGIQNVADRKPMLIYLHNDRSVAAHIFCTNILCSPSMANFLDACGLQIWPWDVTLERGKAIFMGWLEPRLSHLAAQIERMQTDDYPLLIMLCKLSGAYEVTALLTGHGFAPTSSMTSDNYNDDDFPALDLSNFDPSSARSTERSSRNRGGGLDAVAVVVELYQRASMYSSRLEPEKLADQARIERANMRQEQDRAYNESLRQDRLKREAKVKKEAEAVAKEAESQRMAEEAQKAAFERQKAACRALPQEPPAGAAGIATLRFRLPQNAPVPPAFEQIPEENRPQIENGSITRRFRSSDLLKDVKNFMEFLGY
ncbi:hypothetical protein Aperf_G00000115148 [Anoplocephala perfoliata]